MGHLTDARARKIMVAAGNKCEIRRCKFPAQEVHHIKPRSEGGQDVASNLIVLCGSHHNEAHHGSITRTKLRELVKKRNKAAKREIGYILRGGAKAASKGKKKEETLDEYRDRLWRLGMFGPGR